VDMDLKICIASNMLKDSRQMHPSWARRIGRRL
jgi:hypothetical protein